MRDTHTQTVDGPMRQRAGEIESDLSDWSLSSPMQHTHTHMHTQTRIHTLTHTDTQRNTHTQTCTHTLTHRETHTHTQRERG